MAKKKGNAAGNAKNSKLMKSLTSSLPTKNNIKNTALETAKDVAGVVAGGFAGAAIGKPSLLVGIGLAAVGHFIDAPLATSLGIGVMASNGFQGTGSTNGIDGMDGMDIASVKARVNAYKDSFLQKTYIDKIIAKKEGATAKETSGIGTLQFFNHSNEYTDNTINGGYDDMAGLDSIEQQVLQSGMAHMRNNNIEGLEDIEGLDDYPLTDARDYNL